MKWFANVHHTFTLGTENEETSIAKSSVAEQLSFMRLYYIYKGGERAYQVPRFDTVPITDLTKTSALWQVCRNWLSWPPAYFISV